MGITYKENIGDIRNSKVVDFVRELMDFSLQVDVVDPHASPKEVLETYGITLKDEPKGNYDAIILAVPHMKCREGSLEQLKKLMPHAPIFFDLKGVFNKEQVDWRL